ncbi:hypothetical protein TrRE_jg6477, partial [Triparma retinervis]
MNDPLSALLADDDGSSGLFDSFDASKLKLKAPKSKRGSGTSKAGDGPVEGESERGGFGTDVFSNAGGHVGDVGVDLFGGSAALFGEGNIPGDLFDKKKAAAAEKDEDAGADIVASRAFETRGSLDLARPDEDIADLKIATGMLTREDDAETGGFFGESKVKQVVSSDGKSVGIAVDGNVTSEADLNVDDIVGGVEGLGVEKEGRGGRMEDLLKSVLM